MKIADVLRVAAFPAGDMGGNPAGVAFIDEMPSADKMLQIAAEVGYSETAFLHPHEDGWRVRYFAPATEVPFCGHATIATAAMLGARNGAGTYKLYLNDGAITVSVNSAANGDWQASLTSPPTHTFALADAVLDDLLALMKLNRGDLDPKLPPMVAHGGANHPIIGLRSRSVLARVHYPFEPMKVLMQRENFTTIDLIHREDDRLFHARNLFAVGGVVEDPATGAAAAAFGGYLRDIGWPGIEQGGYTATILQGFDMGDPSDLTISVSPGAGEPVTVSGGARLIDATTDETAL